MAINIDNYVDVTSGLGAGSVVTTRALVGRLFTGSPFVPPQQFITFSSAKDVGGFFGNTSEEYYRALFYFSFTSKNLEQPQSIQFARWVNTASAPAIVGMSNSNPIVALWNSVNSGSFGLTINGVSNQISGLNFSGAPDLEGVASIITLGINNVYIITQTGTLNSTVAVTGMASTTGITVGMVVTGDGIADGTTVATVVNGTSITLSIAATATQSSDLSFYATANAQWVDAVVTYNPLSGGFNFTGGSAVSSTITVESGSSGVNIAAASYLGWLPRSEIVNGNLIPANGAIWSNGSAVESITQTLTSSAALSNNFGSFLFLNNLALTNTQIVEAATWNNAENAKYMYLAPVSASNAATLAALLVNIGGVGLTVSFLSFQQTGLIANNSAVVTNLPNAAAAQIGMPVSGTGIPVGTVVAEINSVTSLTLSAPATVSATEVLTFTYNQYPEQFPMMIEAATNYNRPNSVQNYMFQQVAGLLPSVTTDAQAAAYDAINVNYYGQTQSSGTVINFYQRGFLQGQGIVTNITDMTAYTNEIWLKDANIVAIMNLLVGVNQVPANPQGRSQILTVLQQAINQALVNGVISVGKTLTNTQKSYISNITNDSNAWYQVQNDGYWVDCVIEPNPDASGEWQANYTLVYSKDDVIRKVVGQQILI